MHVSYVQHCSGFWLSVLLCWLFSLYTCTLQMHGAIQTLDYNVQYGHLAEIALSMRLSRLYSPPIAIPHCVRV